MPPTTPGSSARLHRPPTRPAPAGTSAGQRKPTPPSPCSAKSPTPARSPKSTTAPTGATAGSLPSPPRSTPASSLAHSQGSPGSWSIFSCRALVSIQLPSTPTRGEQLSASSAGRGRDKDADRARWAREVWGDKGAPGKGERQGLAAGAEEGGEQKRA